MRIYLDNIDPACATALEPGFIRKYHTYFGSHTDHLKYLQPTTKPCSYFMWLKALSEAEHPVRPIDHFPKKTCKYYRWDYKKNKRAKTSSVKTWYSGITTIDNMQNIGMTERCVSETGKTLGYKITEKGRLFLYALEKVKNLG